MHETLKKLTGHVRRTKGSGEALNFYVNYIQPIKKYFGGDDDVKKIKLPFDDIVFKAWMAGENNGRKYLNPFVDLDVDGSKRDFKQWLNDNQ